MKYFIFTPSTFSHIVLFSWETIIIADYWLDFWLVVKLGENINILNINAIKLYLCSSKQKSSEDCRKTLSEEIPLKPLWQRYEINPIYSNNCIYRVEFSKNTSIPRKLETMLLYNFECLVGILLYFAKQPTLTGYLPR